MPDELPHNEVRGRIFPEERWDGREPYTRITPDDDIRNGDVTSYRSMEDLIRGLGDAR